MNAPNLYADWIGRSEHATDIALPQHAAALAALLDHSSPPWPANELPPLGHWLCFLPHVRQSELGDDGHPARGKGGLIPPIDLPRRMWAGSRIRFHSPIALGTTLTRRSTLISVTPKQGRSGAIVLVTLRHDISVNGALAISEEQDVVYRDAAMPGAATSQLSSAPLPAITCIFTPDPVALFRYSALTFNAHRIHYDRNYVTAVEGYAGLVVHGPFTATLLLDRFLRHHPSTRVTAFNFRGVQPLLDTAPFTLGFTATANGADLVALAPDGGVAMTATVEVAH